MLYEYIGDNILSLSEAFQQVYGLQKTLKTCISHLHPHPDMSNAAASDAGKGFRKASCAYCTLLLGSFNSAAAGDLNAATESISQLSPYPISPPPSRARRRETPESEPERSLGSCGRREKQDEAGDLYSIRQERAPGQKAC